MKMLSCHKLMAAFFVTLTTVVSAYAFEPFDANHEPEEIPAFDHLQPVDRAIPEFRYLVQYWVQADQGEQRYVVVIHDESSNRYFMEQGEPPKAERILSSAYKFKTRAEISSSTATMIYELWVNALLQAHYDRRGRSVIGTGGDRFIFSSFVSNLGWMHAYTWTPVQKDLPPDWMCDAGEALFTFITKSESSRSEKDLRSRIQDNRDKLYSYLRAHSCE